MTTRVVVLGAGYAGAGAIPQLEETLPDDTELVWISDTDYHLVLHESHRIISDPTVREKITIPVDDIKSRGTTFVHDRVVGVDVDAREIALESGDAMDYDYLVVAIGTATADFGIEGIQEHAHTLKSLDDALGIHDAITEAAQRATREDPARVVIGGAGLSGIQCAGEVAEFRDRHNAPIEVTLVEALPEIFPPGDAEIQGALRHRLELADVDILTDDPITQVEEDQLHFDERDPLAYDVFVWTGGVTGREEMAGVDLDAQHNRFETGQDFRTSDEHVFAIGDAAVVDQPGDRPAPPTAQAAWQSAEVVADNVARAIQGRPLRTWTYHDQGTLVSIGETAIAHDIEHVPVRTFDSAPATVLKKGAAARWIAKITNWPRALRAWDAL